METCHDCESLPMHTQHRGQATINERYSLGSPTTSCRKAVFGSKSHQFRGIFEALESSSCGFSVSLGGR